MRVRLSSFLLLVLCLMGAGVSPAAGQSYPVYSPANGNWYQAVRLPYRITWAEARVAAEQAIWPGLRGHLATITSPEEDQFINNVVLRGGGNDVWWLGGYQDRSAVDFREPGGGWRWVTGEPFRYSRWHAATGEPNNRGGEDVLDLAQGWGGDWNDESAFYGLPTYIVEYEPVFGSPPFPATNLLINGSFEEPRLRPGQYTEFLPGWRITRGSVDIVLASSWQQAPGEGSQSLDLVGDRETGFPSAGTIEQTFPTVPGFEYRFSGWMAHNWGNPVSPEGRANVYLNGQPFVQLHHRDPLATERDMRWVRFDYRFRAIASFTTLAIADVTNTWSKGGLALDGLSVTLSEVYPPSPPYPSGFQVLVSSHDTHSVLRYDAGSGALIDPFIPTGSGGLGWPHGLALGPDGNLYVSNRQHHSILRYDSRTGAFLGAFVPARSGGLDTPIGLAFGHDGHLYVSSYGTDSILRYDGRTGAFLGAFVARRQGGLRTPYALLFGPDGHLYVCSQSDSSVLRYDGRTGTFLGALVQPGVGGLDGATGIIFGPDGLLYVSSWRNHSILRYDGRTGAFLGAFVPPHSGGLTEPWGLSFGPDGHLYVCSAGTHSVLRYDGRTGSFLGAFIAGSGLQRPDWLLFIPALPSTPPPPSPPVPGPHDPVPAAPTNLTSAFVFNNRIDLRWQDNSDNETHFILWRRTGSSDYVRIGQVNANVTSFTDTGLQPQTTYTYQVRAWNPQGGPSRRSNEFTITTLAPPPGRPNRPTTLVAVPISATEMQLQWQDNSRDEAVFVLWRREKDTEWEKIAVMPANVTRFVDRGLRPGTFYRYQVRAWNPTGGASSPDEASATTPLAQ